ncbi:MAG: NADH-quinone oxidoreductase subunit NuoK [Proteobacteria bacterium]|nr:NADH-quinone oxidoreductase subunit NuoK [Pseudomonadota bacterium]
MAGSLFSYLLLSLILISLGLVGVFIRRNLVIMLICIELILNGVTLNLLAINKFVADGHTLGQVIAIFIIALAAAETTIALALIFLTFKHYKEIDAEKLNELKG